MISITYTATAGQTNYVIPFGYVVQSDLSVTQNDVTVTDWTIVGNEIVLGGSVAVLEDDAIAIIRSTAIAALAAEFSATAALRARELDLIFRQLQFALQEANASATQGLRKNGGGTAWDGESLQIKSVANPTDAQDVATKGWVETALAGDGILPTPTTPDIGKGIRVRSGGGGSPIYAIASVSPAFKVFRIPSQPTVPGGSANGFFVRTNSFGTAWPSQSATRAPLEEEPGQSYLDPDGGAISLDANTFDILVPRGRFWIEAYGYVRNLTTQGSSSILDANVALTDSVGNVYDQSPLLQLGAGGGATDPPGFAGQPSFPFGVSTPVRLLYSVNFLATTRVNLRAVTSGNLNEVVLDYPFRIRVTEIPQ